MIQEASPAPPGLRVRLVRSLIHTSPDQRATARTLGLRRIGQEVVVSDTPAVRGMLFKIQHLIRVDQVGAPHEAS